MNLWTVSIKTVFVLVTLFQYCALAADDANSLYQQGIALERQKQFSDAVAFYNRIITEFPNAPFAGPDKVGYRVKHIACKMALENGDIAAAKKIAEEIRVLPCSAERKPGQLYWTGRLFECKGLFADALTFYDQVMAKYPKALESGPDEAGFQVKHIACNMALENGNIAAAKKIAEEIRVLPCSAERKPTQLYWTGRLFECKGLVAYALTFYDQAMAEYPKALEPWPDKTGFRRKYIACKMALTNGDIAAAKKISEEIRVLPCSAERKPAQLYWTGRLFEDKGLFADALTFYDQVMAEYPKALESGPDEAGYRVKHITCKMALTNGNIAAAKKIAEEIRVLPCSAERKPAQLYWTGRLFECKAVLLMRSEGRDNAGELLDICESLYRKVVESGDSPANAKYFELAEMGCEAIKTQRFINAGDIAAARASVTQIKTKYSGREGLTGILLIIAEGYYGKGISGGGEEFFRQSAMLFEDILVGIGTVRNERAGYTANACYMLGLNYQQLGEYLKAADAFQNAFQANPKHEYADYCLFATGHCYEKLLKQGAISQVDAKAAISAQYQRLKSEFPQSEYIPHLEDKYDDSVLDPNNR